MGTTVVDDIRCFEESGSPAVSASVDICGNRYQVWYRVSEGPIAPGADTFLVAALVPAMRVGEPLRIAGAVSARLLENVLQIQDILHTWYPELVKIPVQAEVKPPGESEVPGGIGCFFSGGLDSSYTVLKRRQEITKLVFVHGFDVRLDDAVLRAKVSQAIREAATELQKPLIEVETNLRDFSDRYAGWGHHYHGAALASVALLLSRSFRESTFPPRTATLTCTRGVRIHCSIPCGAQRPWRSPTMAAKPPGTRRLPT